VTVGIPWGEDLERDCLEMRKLESWGLFARGHHDATCTLHHMKGSTMTPEEAPIGTVCHIGPPRNGKLARKEPDGKWIYLRADGGEVDYDDAHKSMTVAFMPQG